MTENPSEGANLNLDPDQDIPEGVWRLMAISGNISGYKCRNWDTAINSATWFFLGVACGYFMRSILVFLMEKI